MQNDENVQIMKTRKCENVQIEMSKFTLRPENTIPYGRRGTPWKPQNPKNAGPGGSEITKC